MTTKAN